MIIRIAIAALLGMVPVSEVYADNFRCPNGSIVSSGDSISLVAVKCDPPTFVVKREEAEDNYRGRPIYVEVQEWTYNEGPHRLIHFLIFRNGILTEVKSSGFGT